MKRIRAAFAVSLLLGGVVGNLAVAQPGGIIDPDAAVSRVSPGNDCFTFSGVRVALSELKFVAPGYRTVARLRRGADAARLVDGNWATNSGGVAMRNAGPARLRCAVPEEAAGVVFFYTTDRSTFARPTVTLNGSRIELPAVHNRPYECLVRLARKNGRVAFQGEPILNYWDLHGIVPGAVFDETHCEIATNPGDDPLSSGEYRIHVTYVADPKRVRNPAVPCHARLDGLDVTQYDGYVIAFKSPDARRFHVSLIDDTNFSWSGGGGRMEPNEWSALAVPFSAHVNYTTAGDGVLKLGHLRLVYCGIGGRPADAPPTGEYWVAAPKFYKGDPPKGVKVVERKPRPACALKTLSPDRRKPQFFEGRSIQVIYRQGDTVWLGTDRGLLKTSPSQPGLPLARYTPLEGLIDDDVQAIYADGKDLWIGTTCGLSRFDGKQFQNFTSADGLLPGPVMAITSDAKYVWFAMARGIARYDKSTGKIMARKGHGGWSPESTGGQGVPVQEGRGVYADSIAVDPLDGTVWHAAAGIAHSRRDGRQVSHFLGTTTRVLAVYPVSEGIWVVTAHGITLLDRKDGEYKASYGIGGREGIRLGAHPAFITCAYPEKAGIWLGYSDGVGWFDPVKKRSYWSPSYSVALGSLIPQCIFADSRNVWVGTDNGLLVFPKAQALAPWKVLEYSAPTDLWAAGVNLTLEDPDSDKPVCDYGAFQEVTLDEEEGAPGSPGALLLSYDFGKEATEKATLSQRFLLTLPDCNAVSFCARTDKLYHGKRRGFFVDLHFQAKAGKQTRTFVLRQAIQVDTKWRVFKIPFARMRLVSGKGRLDGADRATLKVTGIDVWRSVADFGCPEDSGKLWFDRLSWVKLRGLRA